jgi:osmotically inducible lipoprotein OsmB
MQIKTLLLIGAAAMSLAGCLQDPATRGVGGALAGAVIADALDENIIAGAAVGAVGGAGSCYLPGALNCQQGY